MAEHDDTFETQVSLDYHHDADTVWQRVGGFSTLHEWHPGIVTCEADGEHVGALRRVTLGDGTPIDERLERLDAGERVQVYSMTDPQPPFTSYTSTIHVVATGEGRCRIDWSVRFGVVEGAPGGEVAAMLRGFYLSGLEALPDQLGS